RLGDRDHQRTRLDDRAAIPELGGVLDLGRDARDVFEHVLADQATVPRGAAAEDDHALRGGEFLVHPGEPTELHVAFVGEQTAAYGLTNRLRLLHDLLEHEVRVAAALHLAEVPVDAIDRALNRTTSAAVDGEALPRDRGHVTVVEVDD